MQQMHFAQSMASGDELLTELCRNNNAAVLNAYKLSRDKPHGGLRCIRSHLDNYTAGSFDGDAGDISHL